MSSPLTAHNAIAHSVSGLYLADSASAAKGSRNTTGFANDWLDQALHNTHRHKPASHRGQPETGAGEPSPTDIIAAAGPLPLWLAKRVEPLQQPAKAPARRKSQR